MKYKILGEFNYSEYLDSSFWLERKAHMLKSFKSCAVCCKKHSLVVHHLDYSNVGNEGMKDLLVVCFSCHQKIHNIIERDNDFLKNISHSEYILWRADKYGNRR